MLLTPFAAAAVLARTMKWQEAVALVAIVTSFAMKDPLVVLARQRWVWKTPHPESLEAVRWVIAEAGVSAICGLALVATGPFLAYSLLFGGAAAFFALAVWVNVRNKQRSTIFQVLSAAALTSTSLVADLATTGSIHAWCWKLWALLAIQAAAGIFTVHARLDARVALRKAAGDKSLDMLQSRRTAWVFAVLLGLGGVMASFFRNYWIGGALLLAAAAYLFDLRRQCNADSLQMPLMSVGRQSLSLSLIYAALVVAGLW